MATASPLSVGDARSTSGGTNEDDQARSLEFHCNLLALFAEKATSDPDVEDSCIWTLVDHQGDERSLEEQLVLAYKRSGSIEDNGGWSTLLPVSRTDDWTITKMETSQNTSKVNKRFLTFFKIYTRLQKDPDVPVNFVNAKNVVFYFAHSREVLFPVDWLEKTDIKEFIFGSALWKLRDDPTIREGVEDELKIKCHVDTDLNDQSQIMIQNLGECSESEIREFLARVTFAFYSKTCEILEESAKSEISGIKGDFNPEFIHGRLMARIRERLVCGSRGRKSIRASELIGLLEELRLGGRKEAFKIRFNLCDPVSDFVGRRREMRQVLYLLGGTSKEWEVGPAKKVVLSGLGGVGKSELSREYCRRHLASLYDSIAWINAESKESIAASFRELAFENLEIEKKTPSGDLKDIAEIVGETFDTIKGHRSLVVYDNAESLRQVIKYLPGESVVCRMHIIFTSRSREWDDLPLIPLEYFHEKEALDLVKGSLRHLYTWNEKDGSELCKAFDCYPLALKQAICYIREQDILLKREGKGSSISEYLELLGSNMELELPLSGEIDGGYVKTTNKMIMNTLQYLRKSLRGKTVSLLLDVFSYLSADCIDLHVMHNANPKYKGQTVNKAFTQLCKLSIITIRSRKARIHRLVQAVNRYILRLLGAEVNVLREAITFALPMDVQHMISVWEHAKKHESLIRGNPMFPAEINEKLMREELYDDVMRFCRNNLGSLITVLGPRHPTVTDLLLGLFNAHCFCGEMEKDEGMLKEYLGAWCIVHGPKPQKYFMLLFAYGSSLMKLGRRKESLAAFNEILIDGSPVLGADSDAIQLVKYRLTRMGIQFTDEAGIVNNTEDIEKWMKERSCTGGRKDDDSTSPKDVKLDAEFGKMENMNAFTDRMNAIGGERIPNEIDDRINYAIALCRGGHQKEAVEELQKAKETQRNELGRGNLDTVKISCHMADILLDMGRIKSAEKELDGIFLPIDTSEISNLLKTYVYSLRVKILCARGKSEEAMPIIFKLCLNKSRNAINEDGLRKAMQNVIFSLDAGEFIVVTLMIKGLLATLENCAGMERIPLFFLKFLTCVGVKVAEHGHNDLALPIFNEVYNVLKAKMGETNTNTLFAKVIFSGSCLRFEDRATMRIGLKYLLEVRHTLSKMDVASDPIARRLMDEVTRALKLLSEKLPTLRL